MMTLFTKITLRILAIGIALLIVAVYHTSGNLKFTDDAEEGTIKSQIYQYLRTIKPITIHYCKLNQYYDEEEGRCLGVPGGGKVLHIENGRSCGVNILKPHCTSPLYYHICKRGKSLLAQCASRQIFDNRLQRCVYYDSSKLSPSIILPDDHKFYDNDKMPNCTRIGRFPVPNYCYMFYTCDTNGHRLLQSIFKCPQNTGYQANRGTCAVLPDCKNDDSVDTICAPDAPGENVESLNSNKEGNTEMNVEESTGILEESETTSVNDPVIKREKDANLENLDDISPTTSASEIDSPLSVNNYENNDSSTDDAVTSVTSSSSIPIEDISVSSDNNETSTLNEKLDPTEIVRKALDEIQNEESESISSLGLQVTSPISAEFDDDTPHSITTSMQPEYNTNVNIDNETTDTTPSSSVNYTSPKLDEETDTATEQYRNDDDGTEVLPNSNTQADDPYLTSRGSNIPETSPISNASPRLDEGTQDTITEQYRNDETETLSNSNNEEDDPYLKLTISNIPETSSISDASPRLDEGTQDTITEQYRNDGTETLPNSNNEADDPYVTLTVSNIPEISSISDASPRLDEGTQDTITEQYRNDETETLPNSNNEADDPYVTSTVSNIPEISSISDASTRLDEGTHDTSTEQYRNDETETLSNSNNEADDPYLKLTITNIPETSSISDASLRLDEGTQDTITEQYRNDETETLPNSNNEADDPYVTSTVSNIPEISSISDASPRLDEGTQDTITEQYRNDEIETLPNSNNEADDPYVTSTVNNISETSPINDASPRLDEGMQDVTTEQNGNDEDSTVAFSNFNTEAVDSYPPSTVSNIPESSSTNNTLSKLDEETQDATTEQDKNDDGETETLPNSNTETIDQDSSTLSDTITNSPSNNDFETPLSTSAPNAFVSPQAIDVDQHSTERLSQTSSSVE